MNQSSIFASVFPKHAYIQNCKFVGPLGQIHETIFVHLVEISNPKYYLFIKVLTGYLQCNPYWLVLNFVCHAVSFLKCSGYMFSSLTFSLCHIDFLLYSLQIVRERWETLWQGASFTLVCMNKTLKMVTENTLNTLLICNT